MIEYCPKFLGYCRSVTDRQLENILRAEYAASQHNDSRKPDYEAANLEAYRRNWTVKAGERV